MSLPTSCLGGPSTVECMSCGRKHMVCGTIAAVVRRIEEERDEYRARLAACERVVEAARALRDSGYDGPMMGDEVAPLFSALAALDGKEAES